MSGDEVKPIALELHILAGMLVKMGKRDLEHRLDSYGLCIGALPFGILQILSRDEHTISELGRHLMIAPATLVPVVDNLEREGLVHRGQDPRDRRRTPVSITEHGARVISRVPVLDKDDALIRSLEQMGPEKAERLLTLVRDLLAGMWESDHPRSGRSMVDSLRASVREQLGCDQVAGQAQPVNLGSDRN